MDESEIPIDIHTSKLMDWLVSRRHVPREWNQKVLKIREKINEAIKDMPEDKGITMLLSGSYINYYHCQKLVEILKETEAKSKNLFGQYNSKRMKDWMEIIKLYEKENIYLGEVASLLQRNINYEIPALKKQMTRNVHMVEDCNKKISNYERQAESLKKDFNTTCKSLGIKGVKIRQELNKKAAEFPEMCQKIAIESKSLQPAVNYYSKVVESIFESEKQVLEMLQYVIRNGDTTVYQWKYNRVPSSVESIVPEVEDEEDVIENNDEIDFGIDTDINVDDSIDWGISTVDSETAEVPEIVEVVEDKTAAKGYEARTILSHPETRNPFLNNIMELEAFLKVRLHEITSEEEDLTLTVIPESFQMHNSKEIQGMLTNVQSVLESLTNPVILHYLNIITNKKYVDELTEKLKQKLSAQEKMLLAVQCVKNQKEDIIKEGESLKPKLDLLIEKTKELQELIEQDISKRYKGRPVNLIGGAHLL